MRPYTLSELQRLVNRAYMLGERDARQKIVDAKPPSIQEILRDLIIIHPVQKPEEKTK